MAEDAADGRNDVIGEGRSDAEVRCNLLGESEIQCVVVLVDAKGEPGTVFVRIQIEGG